MHESAPAVAANPDYTSKPLHVSRHRAHSIGPLLSPRRQNSEFVRASPGNDQPGPIPTHAKRVPGYLVCCGSSTLSHARMQTRLHVRLFLKQIAYCNSSKNRVYGRLYCAPQRPDGAINGIGADPFEAGELIAEPGLEHCPPNAARTSPTGISSAPRARV